MSKGGGGLRGRFGNASCQENNLFNNVKYIPLRPAEVFHFFGKLVDSRRPYGYIRSPCVFPISHFG